jgi:hypothetical protein
MNNVQQLFADMTDEQLFKAIEEINEHEQTGGFGDIVRDYSVRIQKITGINNPVGMDLINAQLGIWREGALRWSTQQRYGVSHNSNKDQRKYTEKLPDYGDLFTVEEWNEDVLNGSFVSSDGNGWWVKNGLMCHDWNDEVFRSPQLDATHVMWFNK